MSGGDFQVQGDVDHDGMADFTFLVHAASLAASDFVLATANAAGLIGPQPPVSTTATFAAAQAAASMGSRRSVTR